MASRFITARAGALAASLAVTALVAGCGGSSSPTTKTQATKRAATHKSVATHKAAARPASQGSALSGKWSGHYGGAYSGTFVLNWTQTGSKLSGQIQLSSPAETTGITGSVSNGAIKFGTVSGALYNGTVSGSSMSGNYTTPAGGGSWSASRG